MAALNVEDPQSRIRNERSLRTQRKIKVNAQITFLLWLMESSICIVPLILYMFVRHMVPATFTLNMMLFLVILPYTYLQNTSNNKSRIVEEGWLNVLRNVVSCVEKGRTNQTRVYVISTDPLVVRRINSRKYNLQLPIQAEQNDVTGKTEHGTSKTEQAVLNDTQHGKHYFFSD